MIRNQKTLNSPPREKAFKGSRLAIPRNSLKSSKKLKTCSRIQWCLSSIQYSPDSSKNAKYGKQSYKLSLR